MPAPITTATIRNEAPKRGAGSNIQIDEQGNITYNNQTTPNSGTPVEDASGEASTRKIKPDSGLLGDYTNNDKLQLVKYKLDNKPINEELKE